MGHFLCLVCVACILDDLFSNSLTQVFKTGEARYVNSGHLSKGSMFRQPDISGKSVLLGKGECPGLEGIRLDAFSCRVNRSVPASQQLSSLVRDLDSSLRSSSVTDAVAS